MNTANVHTIPMLPETGRKEYVYCLEELELTFPKEQLKEITRQWNNGASVEYLARKYKRHEDEVFLSLFHQARKGKIKRPFAYQQKQSAAIGKGTKHKAVVEVKKMKKGKPSVIEINGERYVLEPKTKRK